MSDWDWRHAKSPVGSMSMMVPSRGWYLMLSAENTYLTINQSTYLQSVYLAWASHNMMIHTPSYLHAYLLSVRCPYAFTFGDSFSTSLSLFSPNPNTNNRHHSTKTPGQIKVSFSSLQLLPSVSPDLSYSAKASKILILRFYLSIAYLLVLTFLESDMYKAQILLALSFVCYIYQWSVTSLCQCVILCRVRLFVTPWTVAHQAPLSMRLPRQEYWSELSFFSPGDLPDPGVEPGSPALQVDSFPSEPPGKPPVVRNIILH